MSHTQIVGGDVCDVIYTDCLMTMPVMSHRGISLRLAAAQRKGTGKCRHMARRRKETDTDRLTDRQTDTIGLKECICKALIECDLKWAAPEPPM